MQYRNKPSLLIVEENRNHVKRYREIFEDRFELHFIMSKEFCDEFLKYHDPCVIIIEIEGEDDHYAWEMLRYVKNKPVLVITSSKNKEVYEDFFKMGAFEYIKRPISNVEIIKKAIKLVNVSIVRNEC